MSDPKLCFGKDFITFEQLTSPEWQLCATEDGDVEHTYMCVTDSPSEILMRLQINDVQEDSFALDKRRKTKNVPTTAFLNKEDTDTYNKVCPIDHNYAQDDYSCTGSYRQGGFQFYPPFVMKGCQCKELLDSMEESSATAWAEDEGGYSAPLMYVTDEKQTASVKNPASPCMWKMENEQRKTKDMPNMWSKMNTIQLSVNVRKVPEGGEILLLSNYRPDFWLNQPKLITRVITAEDVKEADGDLQVMFKSTNEIWLITRCTTFGETCGAFEFDYSKVTFEAVVIEGTDWSMIITIYIGFTMMLISFLYFEWRCVFQCIKRCRERCTGKKQSSTSPFDDANDQKGDNGTGQIIPSNDMDLDIDDNIMLNNLDRLVSKTKKNDKSEDHGFEGHDYASNRQN